LGRAESVEGREISKLNSSALSHAGAMNCRTFFHEARSNPLTWWRNVETLH